MLVGREVELAAVASALRAGRSVLVVGEPGIGKSALLDAVAADPSVRVLHTAGVDAGQAAPFSGLVELLAPVADQVGAVQGERGQALAAALGLGPAVPGDRLAVAVAALDVLAALAPLVVVADDLHDVDPETGECLAFLAHHGADRGVGVLAATRPDGLDPPRGFEVVALGGLDDPSARELLVGLGVGGATIAETIALAGGNPLALRELPAVIESGAVTSSTAPVDPGALVRSCFRRRIEELDGPVRRALLLAAADPVRRLGTVEAACCVVADEGWALDELFASGLLIAADDRVGFDHPLLAGVAYHEATPAERRHAHATLASVTTGSASTWHRAADAQGFDEDLAAELDGVATDAQARRAYHRAADAFARAAALTADDDGAAFRLIGAGASALAAGRPTRAAGLAEQARSRAGTTALRAMADHLGGVVGIWHFDVVEAGLRLGAAARRIAAELPDQAAAMLADASVAATSAGECRRALVDAEEAHDLAAGAADPVRAVAGTALAWALVLTGDIDRGTALYEATEPYLAAVDPLSPAAQSIAVALNVRAATGDQEQARSEALAMAEAAEGAGAWSMVAFPLVLACEAGLRLGTWDDLEATYRRALSRAEEVGQGAPRGMLLASRARLRAARGEAAGCRADVDGARAVARELGVASLESYALSALGLLALGEDRLDDAIETLEELRRIAVLHGQRHPSLVPWASELVESLCRSGRRREAAALVDELDSAGHGDALAALVGRCRVSCADDVEAAFAALALVGPHHHGTFEVARVELVLGERRRRERRLSAAREPLRRAQRTFERLGARPWAARAAAELRAVSGRPPDRAESGVGSLSSQQRRIAAAVARGSRNREVAAELFLSEKTVEYHLSRIYRQLGVRSRTELAARLAATTGDSPDSPVRAPT